MFQKDGVCYAGDPGSYESELAVIEAKPLQGGMILVTFSNNEKKLFDSTILTGSVFEALRNENVFYSLSLFNGIITWDDGRIDISTDFVYSNSVGYIDCDIIKAG